jgi:hypothetical protein
MSRPGKAGAGYRGAASTVGERGDLRRGIGCHDLRNGRRELASLHDVRANRLARPTTPRVCRVLIDRQGDLRFQWTGDALARNRKDERDA